MLKRVLGAAVCGVLTLTLSACSPAIIGHIALARASNATVSAVVVVCEGNMNAIAVRPAAMSAVLGGSAVPSPGERMTWRVDPSVDGTLDIPLDGLDSYMVSGLFTIEGRGGVESFLGIEDQGRLIGPERFARSDIASLGEDQVLTSDTNEPGFRVIERDQFLNDACA